MIQKETSLIIFIFRLLDKVRFLVLIESKIVFLSEKKDETIVAGTGIISPDDFVAVVHQNNPERLLFPRHYLGLIVAR